MTTLASGPIKPRRWGWVGGMTALIFEAAVVDDGVGRESRQTDGDGQGSRKIEG